MFRKVDEPLELVSCCCCPRRVIRRTPENDVGSRSVCQVGEEIVGGRNVHVHNVVMLPSLLMELTCLPKNYAGIYIRLKNIYHIMKLHSLPT